MREPTIARWPGPIPDGTSTGAVSCEVDLLSTFVKLAGGSVPAGKKIGGAGILQLLLMRAESP